MGQKQSQEANLKSLNLMTFLSRDPRLIEKLVFVPELFPKNLDSQVKDIQRVCNRLPRHSLFEAIVDGLDERFFRDQNPKDKKVTWHQLQTIERFKHLLQKIERSKHVEDQLLIIVEKQMIKSRKITLRKKIEPFYKTQLNQLLFNKLFLHYYLIVLRKYFGSKQQEEKKLVENFHNKIGKLLCQMMEQKHLQLQILTQLTYKVVCIEKNNSREYLTSTLGEIHERFHPIYLKQEHSIGVKEPAFQQYKAITRTYLDQLYLSALKEAEDPDINIQEDSLGTIKNFPLVKIKRK